MIILQRPVLQLRDATKRDIKSRHFWTNFEAVLFLLTLYTERESPHTGRMYIFVAMSITFLSWEENYASLR